MCDVQKYIDKRSGRLKFGIFSLRYWLITNEFLLPFKPKRDNDLFFFIDENSNEAADPEMINKLFD